MIRVLRFFATVLLLLTALPLLIFLAALALYYRNETRYRVFRTRLENIGKDRLGPYYMNLSTGGRLEDGPVWLVTNGRRWLHPIRNTHLAFKHYREYLDTGVQQHLHAFLAIADALIEHAVDDGEIEAWPYWSPAFPGQQLPWLSAMAQGQAIGVLARACEETGDPRYLEAAKRARRTFERDIEDGGVRNVDDRGVFYEEYACHERQHRYHVLNGMISSLFGLYDLHKVCGDLTAKELFEQGLATIRDHLPDYDRQFLSSYDLRREMGEYPLFLARYNQVHVSHLRVLHAMTGDAYFEAVAELWDRKLKDPWNRLRLTLWYAGYLLREVRAGIAEHGAAGVPAAVAPRMLRRIKKLAG